MLLSLVLLVTMAAAASASPDIRVIFDEQAVQFDASPFTENDRTLVPVRALAERLGFAVGWDEREQKITLTRGETTILLWIGTTKVVVNGKEEVVEAAPKQVSNRTFVPLRFVAERLGAHVAWDQNQQAAVITSGKAFITKMNRQQTLVDQQITGDIQMQMSMKRAADPKAVDFNMPVHIDMQIYHNDMLMVMTMSLPKPIAAGSPGGNNSLTVQVALKDGKLYMQDPLTQEWRAAGSMDEAMGAPGLSAFTGKNGFADLMKLQTELLQDAVVSVGGQEEIDGVKVIRLDADLSKVKFGAVVDTLIASLPIGPGAQKPDFKLNVDRYLANYWINPETQFTHKVTLDIAISMAMGNAEQAVTGQLAMKGELRGRLGSEPIKFPDFSASSFTAEQKQAAQAYWVGLTRDVPVESCMKAAQEVGAHWTASTFSAGKDAAVKAAACFTQQGQALAALKPPAGFADAHNALSVALTASAKGYTGYSEAFALAAKGDMTAANAGKSDAAKGAAEAEKSLIQAALQIIKAAAKYGLH
jgi:hypothetical protein